MNSPVLTRLKRSLPLLFIVLATLASPLVYAATVGTQLKNPQLRDANDKPSQIPNFGKKVLAIFYTDPDVSDQNDPFADVLKAANLPKDKYQGIGIANMKDAPWTPNAVIRAIIRRKIEKYDATILTDPDRLLQKAWSLGSCDEQSVVFIFDHTGTLQYVKKGAMTAAEQKAGLAMVQNLISKVGAP